MLFTRRSPNSQKVYVCISSVCILACAYVQACEAIRSKKCVHKHETYMPCYTYGAHF